MTETNKPKHVCLFSGIGGFALAAQWAGFETVQFVEKDAYCQRVLTKNFPGTPIHDRIETFAPAYDFQHRGVGRINLLTGGFPCQPFSLAGKKLGAADDRYLWPEMFRVIGETRPDWIVIENTPHLLTLVFDDIAADLEGAGYEVGAVVLPACAVNAPHKRLRVWIVAHASASGRRKKQPDLHGRQRNATRRIAPHADGERQQQSGRPLGEVRERTANSAAPHANDFDGRAKPQDERSSKGAWGEPARGAVGDADHARQQTEWNAPGLPDILATFERADWRAVEPLLCRGDHGVPHRVDRLRGLGNAIVPQVVYPLLREIADQIRLEI